MCTCDGVCFRQSLVHQHSVYSISNNSFPHNSTDWIGPMQETKAFKSMHRVCSRFTLGIQLTTSTHALKFCYQSKQVMRVVLITQMRVQVTDMRLVLVAEIRLVLVAKMRLVQVAEMRLVQVTEMRLVLLAEMRLWLR